MTKKQYILFVAQEANFRSRSMLMPADAFMAARGEEWKAMLASSESAVLQGIPVHNLLWIDVVWEGNMGTPMKTPWLQFGYMLMHYADCWDRGDWWPQDCPWLEEAIFELDAGFNHVKHYAAVLADQHQYEIVDSCLILQRDQGQGYKPPLVDTKEELVKMLASRQERNKENL